MGFLCFKKKHRHFLRHSSSISIPARMKVIDTSPVKVVAPPPEKLERTSAPVDIDKQAEAFIQKFRHQKVAAPPPGRNPAAEDTDKKEEAFSQPSKQGKVVAPPAEKMERNPAREDIDKEAEAFIRHFHEHDKVVAPRPPPPSKKLERIPTKEDIDKQADAFIQQFNHQLLVQRLKSIENDNKMRK
ncbi:unnamed protein product [Cuscuta epithymum]|uniref:DUF4408 domain-containing protein n=1 Tax=Cuscuta epithymum TaxID=186058 RepID=A0AAV0EST5_9ASTE|nr:unnamed protein product [Cuscuta epithymum]CAH9126327.1 unnamed protein product [Cuscuta epithymum]